jgi:hypothetical protein
MPPCLAKPRMRRHAHTIIICTLIPSELEDASPQSAASALATSNPLHSLGFSGPFLRLSVSLFLFSCFLARCLALLSVPELLIRRIALFHLWQLITYRNYCQSTGSRLPRLPTSTVPPIPKDVAFWPILYRFPLKSPPLGWTLTSLPHESPLRLDFECMTISALSPPT